MTTEFWDYKDKIAFDKEKPGKTILMETPHSRTTLWCLLQGQHIHPHEHEGDHIWIVLEGVGTYLGDGGPRRVVPGTILVAPQGQAHGIENPGQEGLVFVSVSAGA